MGYFIYYKKKEKCCESFRPHHHLWLSPPHLLWTDDALDPSKVSHIQDVVPKPSRGREIWLGCSMYQEENEHTALLQYSYPPLSLPTSSTPFKLRLTYYFGLHRPFPWMPSGWFFSCLLQILEAQAEREWLSCLLHHREEWDPGSKEGWAGGLWNGRGNNGNTLGWVGFLPPGLKPSTIYHHDVSFPTED